MKVKYLLALGFTASRTMAAPLAAPPVGASLWDIAGSQNLTAAYQALAEAGQNFAEACQALAAASQAFAEEDQSMAEACQAVTDACQAFAAANQVFAEEDQSMAETCQTLAEACQAYAAAGLTVNATTKATPSTTVAPRAWTPITWGPWPFIPKNEDKDHRGEIFPGHGIPILDERNGTHQLGPADPFLLATTTAAAAAADEDVAAASSASSSEWNAMSWPTDWSFVPQDEGGVERLLDDGRDDNLAAALWSSPLQTSASMLSDGPPVSQHGTALLGDPAPEGAVQSMAHGTTPLDSPPPTGTAAILMTGNTSITSLARDPCNESFCSEDGTS